MKTGWIILAGLVLAIILGLLVWLANGQGHRLAGSVENLTQPDTKPAPPETLHLALVPERNVFALRRSYEPLAGELSSHLGRPVQLVMLNTYEAVLQDFQERQIDGAFLGSLVAVLAMDRCGARVLVRPERPDGVSMYRGVIFVPQGSAIRSIDELRGRPIAMLRTTYAGTLFPLAEIVKRGWLRDATSQILWAGTHEDVIAEVLAGRADAGAAKDLVLNAFEKDHPQSKVRRLATSEPVPNNALVLSATVSPETSRKIAELLLHLHEDARGRQALESLGAKRFIPCPPAQYQPIFEMIDILGPEWNRVGVAGNAPSRGVLQANP